MYVYNVYRSCFDGLDDIVGSFDSYDDAMSLCQKLTDALYSSDSDSDYLTCDYFVAKEYL